MVKKTNKTQIIDLANVKIQRVFEIFLKESRYMPTLNRDVRHVSLRDIGFGDGTHTRHDRGIQPLYSAAERQNRQIR